MDRFTAQGWDRDVLGSAQPLAVVFWAEWSVPSRMAVDTAQALAEERAGGPRLGLLDVDQSPQVAERYSIQGLPTILVLKGGQVTERRVGLMSRPDLARLLDRHRSPSGKSWTGS